MRAPSLDVWRDICSTVFGVTQKSNVDIHPIHQCVINGEPHFVHAPFLELNNPAYFARLQDYAKQRGIKLKADQRTHQVPTANCQRRKIWPTVLLALCLSSELVQAEDVDVSLKLLSNQPNKTSSKRDADETTRDNFGDITTASINTVASQRIEQILISHFEHSENTPLTINEDLREIANYYSRYPDSIALVESLENADWSLKFSPHTFETNIKGSQLEVKSVEVLFDPRSGAKLKFNKKCDQEKPFCIASPADALLHEFLHAQAALNDTNNFIAQGGLNPFMYPVEHERLTIMKENVLYKTMSELDHHPRPARNEHNGRHVAVSCVTCLE